MWGFPLQRNKMGVLCIRLFAVISSIPEVALCCRPSVKIQYVVSFKEFHLVAREAAQERREGGICCFTIIIHINPHYYTNSFPVLLL